MRKTELVDWGAAESLIACLHCIIKQQLGGNTARLGRSEIGYARMDHREMRQRLERRERGQMLVVLMLNAWLSYGIIQIREI